MDRTHHHNAQIGAASLVGVVGRGDPHHVAGRQLGQLVSSGLERPGHGHPTGDLVAHGDSLTAQHLRAYLGS
jgi:hypothetical protein